jgi:hypothetical protein
MVMCEKHIFYLSYRLTYTWRLVITVNHVSKEETRILLFVDWLIVQRDFQYLSHKKKSGTVNFDRDNLNLDLKFADLPEWFL